MYFIRGGKTRVNWKIHKRKLLIFIYIYSILYTIEKTMCRYIWNTTCVYARSAWFEAERYRFSLRAISLLHTLSICVAYCKFHRRFNMHKARSIKHSSIVASRIVIFLPHISIIWKKKRKKKCMTRGMDTLTKQDTFLNFVLYHLIEEIFLIKRNKKSQYIYYMYCT